KCGFPGEHSRPGRPGETDRAHGKDRRIERTGRGCAGLTGAQDPEDRQAGEEPRRAQGSLCSADWGGYAVNPNGDIVPEQPLGRTAPEEAGTPAAGRRRAVSGDGRLPGKPE